MRRQLRGRRPRMARVLLLLGVPLLGAVALLVVLAGGGDGPKIAADPALAAVLKPYGDELDAQLLAGSPAELARRVRGREVDVVMSADAKLLASLHGEGLTSAPILFAWERPILVVRRGLAGLPRRMSLRSLRTPGLRVALASERSRAGVAARGALRRERLSSIVGRASLRPPDGAGVAAALAAGGADAGIALESELAGANVGRDTGFSQQPVGASLEYSLAIVTQARDRGAAQVFVYGLMSGDVTASIRGRGIRFGVLPMCGANSAKGARCPDPGGTVAPREF